MKNKFPHPANPPILQILFQTMFYRQGSITALLKQNGAVSEKYSYDAYGRRRNPANWNENCQNQNFQDGWIFRIFKDDETV